MAINRDTTNNPEIINLYSGRIIEKLKRIKDMIEKNIVQKSVFQF